MVTNAGAGYSVADGLAITRWRDDPTAGAFGQFFYVRDLGAGKYWSAAHQPTCREADEYEVIFASDKAEFRRLDGRIETRMEVAVSPENHVEVRRLTFTNLDRRPHDLEVTSYLEIVLTNQGADVSHPAFGKLFLETEFLPKSSALLCRRRPRSVDQKPMWVIHVLAAETRMEEAVQFETDRARFIGRARTLDEPVALDFEAKDLSGTVGPVLDPILSLRQRFRIEAGTSLSIGFTTALAETRDQAIALSDVYHDFHSIHRAFELAWAHAQVELQQLHLTAGQAHTFQRLTSHIVFAGALLRPPSQVCAANHLGQVDLWRLGLSGDLPIVLFRIASTDELAAARQMIVAHTFWRLKGLAVDLVILNDEQGGYFEELHQQLQSLVRASDDRNQLDKPGGVFLRKMTHLTKEDQLLLQAAARCVIIAKRGMLTRQLEGLARVIPAAHS
jgi:cyclic beta-1,2-glucan synthetase